MRHWWDAFKVFFQRYKEAWIRVWQIRDQLDPPDRTGEELAFLPAHLELVETPVNPIPRWSMRAIVLFAAIALLWAIFGHLDIVATSTGKTVTGGRTKIIQPLEPAVVESIYVKDGQHVKKGDLLIKLDTTTANAEYLKAKEALTSNSLSKARYDALLTALETGKTPTMGELPSVEESRRLSEESVAIAQWQSYVLKIETQKAQILQKEAEISTINQQVRKLSSTSRLIAQQAADYKRLYEQNFMSRHAWMQKEQERIEQQADLATQQSRLKELQAALKAQQQEMNSTTAQFKSDALDRKRQAVEAIEQYEQEAKKNRQREEIMTLTAPVTGTVQQLAIHTVGGVVTEAQALMAIVPDDETIEVEVMVENKDIGFVKPGQVAVVKLETFPYTRYGYLEGIVDHVSYDAVQDEQRGLIFPARVRLNKTHFMIDDTRVNLTSGMSVTTEIKIGKRRVIDYFLSPLREYKDEGLREK